MLLLLILKANWSYSLCDESDYPQQGVLDIPSWNVRTTSVPNTCTRCGISLEGSLKIRNARMAIYYRDRRQWGSKFEISLRPGVATSGRFKVLDNSSTPRTRLLPKVLGSKLLGSTLQYRFVSYTYVDPNTAPPPFHLAPRCRPLDFATSWYIQGDGRWTVSNSYHIFKLISQTHRIQPANKTENLLLRWSHDWKRGDHNGESGDRSLSAKIRIVVHFVDKVPWQKKKISALWSSILWPWIII